MTHQGGAAVHQCPCAVECPCTRRSLTAATDAIGAHRFNVTRYELQLPPRDRHVREARVASALSPYNILPEKSKIAINPDFSVPISPFRLLSQKKSVMMAGRICNCIFHGRFCRCPALFRCITQPRPVKTNKGHGLSPGRLSKKLPSQKLRREEKRERKPSGCPFASNHPPQRQNCKIRYNKILFCNSESSLAKSPKGFFDKLTGFRPAPTGLCLHAGEEGFSWKKMICYGSWGPSPNPFF